VAAKRASSAPSDEPVPDQGARADARVAAIIVAFNQQRRVASTVRGALSIPAVDLVLVIDDGSTDQTQAAARDAGAVVVRHSHRRGRSAAVETAFAVVTMRDEPGVAPRHFLLLDGGLGEHAVGAAPLVSAVTEGAADLAIAVSGGPCDRATRMASTLARGAISRASGWFPTEPLSRTRCLTRAALEAAIPLARGAGLDVGMTLDVLLAGLTATEVECEIRVRPAPAGALAPLLHANQYRDVLLAVGARRLRSGLEATQSVVDPRGLFYREDDE
jgi:Glycosyl transferase family 2